MKVYMFKNTLSTKMPVIFRQVVMYRPLDRKVPNAPFSLFNFTFTLFIDIEDNQPE